MKAGLVAVGLVALVFLFPTAAAAAGPLGVEAFVAGPKDRAEAVVTVRNSGTTPADVVSVALWQGRNPVGARNGSRLAAGQAAVFRLPIGADEYAGGGLYVLVTSRTGTVTDGTAVAIAPPKASEKPGNGVGPAVVTALLSVGSLLTGILVTEFLTRRRERSRSALDARRKDVERDTPAYRAFVADWQGSLDPAHLAGAFKELLGAARVPESVREIYRETLDELKDPAATAEAKREAAKRLRQAVEELTSTPALG